MRSVFAAFIAIWVFASAAYAQAEQAIQNVIAEQLQAFNDRDIDKAWGFASPMIQGIFGNAGNFGSMVQRGYPMVWDNRDVKFMELDQADGAQRQRVLLRDTSGGYHLLEYQMLQTPDGWLIDGVQVLPAPDLGV